MDRGLIVAFFAAARGGSSLICKEGGRFSMGWCMREPYCPLSSAVYNATIPTLSLFEMAKSACSPFCYILHYLLFIKSCCSAVQYSTVYFLVKHSEYFLESIKLFQEIDT
jgi:hypothetical protein